MEDIMHISILEKKPTWELKAMVKALSLPVASFLNTEQDNKKLEDCKKILKEREKKTKKSEIDESIELEKQGKELSDSMSDAEIELRGNFPKATDDQIKKMLEGGI
tara:strand:- start:480 stop:797 length:318 start_codon:yes stop_codon:yes gene_type:complete